MTRAFHNCLRASLVERDAFPRSLGPRGPSYADIHPGRGHSPSLLTPPPTLLVQLARPCYQWSSPVNDRLEAYPTGRDLGRTLLRLPRR